MILYGSSGVGEPMFSGALPVEIVGEPSDAPLVELGLTYDSSPSPIRAALIPPWLLMVGGLALVANWAGMRIGGR